MVILTWVERISINVLCNTLLRWWRRRVIRILVVISVLYRSFVRKLNVLSVPCQVNNRHVLKLRIWPKDLISQKLWPVLDSRNWIMICLRRLWDPLAVSSRMLMFQRVRLMKSSSLVDQHVFPRSNLSFLNSLVVRNHRRELTPMSPSPTVPPFRVVSCQARVVMLPLKSFFLT